jgi:PHD/YefM family antitoxin component YafN of YafNO toxin-antitoxin module
VLHYKALAEKETLYRTEAGNFKAEHVAETENQREKEILGL